MKNRILIFSALSMLITIIWVNIPLNMPFLWDDHGIILSNNFIGCFWNPSGFIPKYYFQMYGELSYRPLVTLSHLLDNAILLKNHFVNHFTNLLFHTANTCLLFSLLRHFLSFSKLESTFITVIFAIHPIHIEALAIASYRDDILMSFFSLMALRKFFIFQLNRKFTTYLSLLIFFILSALSKESGILLLPVILGLIVVCKNSFNAKLKDNILFYIGIFTVCFLYLSIRFHFAKNPEDFVGQTYFCDKIPLLIRPFLVIGTAFKQCLIPSNTILDYNNLKTLYSLGTQGLALFAALLLLRRKLFSGNALKLGLIFSLIPLVSVFNIYPLENFFANRYCYFPLIGFLIIITRVIVIIFKDSYRLCFSFFLLFTVYMSVLSLCGQRFFLSDTSFASKLIVDCPTNYKAHNYLGTISQDKGDFKKAEFYYSKAVELNPSFYEANYNLANIYLKNNNYNKAKTISENLARLNPLRPDAYRMLGDIMSAQGNNIEASRYYQTAVSKYKYDTASMNNLGSLYESSGMYGKASEMYIKALSVNPNFDLAWSNLGNINIKRGDFKSAEKCYVEALKINPENSVTWYNLGNAFFYQNNFAGSEKCYIQSISLNPNNADSIRNLSVVYLKLNKLRQAVSALETYLKIAPTDEEAKNQLKILKNGKY